MIPEPQPGDLIVEQTGFYNPPSVWIVTEILVGGGYKFSHLPDMTTGRVLIDFAPSRGYSVYRDGKQLF